jgi:translation initiation factor IF-2
MQETNSPQSGNIARPPVVAILGHVDHGKTSLLDKIRNTNLTAREAGGITQSIGAWQVKAKNGKAITFIDTPGHAAFEGMRSRGAKIADLAILIIAADDGIMPQTKQSIQFIKDSKTPFLVAITKIDLPGAQVDKVKGQLLELEIVPEDYGGDIVVVPVSNKTGEGIDSLLEMIALMSELNEISGNPSGTMSAYILEAEKDPRRGVVVSIIVKNGTLKIGDMISAGEVNGKVRGLFDEARKPIREVGPSGSAEVIGLAALPEVGTEVKIQ